MCNLSYLEPRQLPPKNELSNIMYKDVSGGKHQITTEKG